MPTILIVDDNKIDHQAARRYLSRVENLDVRQAFDGVHALEEIERQLPDIVLTDLRMPRMNGLELVERLHESRPLLPVVLMTSQGNEKIAVEALQAGAASYVPKGVLKEELADTIERVLEIAAAKRSQLEIVRFLDHTESEFALRNDPELIAPLVSYLLDSLDRVGFGDDSDRASVRMAIMEAVSNSMIHGNLEVSSELRSSDRDSYYRLIEERRRTAPYSERRVRCRARENGESVEYVIQDEGPGFDPASVGDPMAPENLLSVSGRGIMLIGTFMDEFEYNEKGNQITMRKRRTAATR